ncbi:hypothetical protein, partial [Aeromicrobium sp.]|uniref:hypothetical protein n=1 Tax=Aeromicrobium sp. TaxID=1871063 RepID=UPI003C50FD7C
MVSTSSDTIATLGSTVHVAGQVRSSQAGKGIVFQLRELAADGSVIQEFDGNTTPSSTSWLWTGATITTTRANSKVNLFVSEVGVTSDNFLKVRTINSDVTPPSTTPSPTPTPTPTPRPTPSPTPTSTSTPPSGSCADIDYSKNGQGH